ELDKVADDLRQFLELLERSLTRFVVDGEPGSL
ncbi:SMI1/KNR4 family protein, partial [Streptomyces sp. SID6648]|nr:SMI1/KNR4 family protein [Streptomyces sp. SID6648]